MSLKADYNEYEVERGVVAAKSTPLQQLKARVVTTDSVLRESIARINNVTDRLLGAEPTNLTDATPEEDHPAELPALEQALARLESRTPDLFAALDRLETL